MDLGEIGPQMSELMNSPGEYLWEVRWCGRMDCFAGAHAVHVVGVSVMSFGSMGRLLDLDIADMRLVGA